MGSFDASLWKKDLKKNLASEFEYVHIEKPSIAQLGGYLETVLPRYTK